MSGSGLIAPARRRKLARDQSGQVTVFFALSMGVLVCLMAFMANLGQVVHEKVLAQTVADMAALSGATVQAVGLNEMADLNSELVKLSDDARRYLNGRRFVGSHGTSLYERYRYYTELVAGLIKDANHNYAQRARDAAQRTVNWFNARYGVRADEPKDTEAKRSFTVQQVGEGSIYPYGQLVTLWQHESSLSWYDDYRCVCRRTRRGLCCGTCACAYGCYSSGWRKPSQALCNTPGSKKGPRKIIARLAKPGDAPTCYYAVRVGRSKVRTMVDLPFFQVKIPAVEAYAMAIPTGGSIFDARPEYRARLVHLRYATDGSPESSWAGGGGPVDRGRFRH